MFENSTYSVAWQPSNGQKRDKMRYRASFGPVLHRKGEHMVVFKVIYDCIYFILFERIVFFFVLFFKFFFFFFRFFFIFKVNLNMLNELPFVYFSQVHLQIIHL